MTATWTVKDGNGQLLADFICGSRLEVGRRIVPTYNDAFRLQVSASYRELFDRALRRVLERQGWQIVRIKAAEKASRAASCTVEPARCPAGNPSLPAATM